MLARLKHFARKLHQDIHTLYYVARDEATPLPARLLVVMVVAYAFSPIDLIPDFIPVIGMLDDMILLPLGIWLAIRLIPESLLIECRNKAIGATSAPGKTGYIGAAGVLIVWFILAALIITRFY